MDADLIATKANLVLQVNRSHLERIKDLITTHYVENDGVQTPTISILAAKKATVSQSNSLIFLDATDTVAFIKHFINQYKFVLQGLNKIFVRSSERSTIGGRFSPVKESDVACGDTPSNDTCISHYLFKLMKKLQHDNNDTSSKSTKAILVKVDVFPSKLQRQVVSNLTTILNANSIPESELDVTPTDQTHNLSIVQIDTGTNNHSEKDITCGTFLVGIAPWEQSPPIINTVNTSNDICRAYFKLSEAFERYRHQNNHIVGDDSLFSFSKVGSGSKRKNNCPNKPVIAVDCGSAPGGWTKYLTEQTACDEVYAIDPGDMDKSVSSLSNVHHMKMTADKAIPELRDKDVGVALWVSDMCVHDIPKQVDTFLLAYNEGIFQPNAAFVLTIKCNVGHGKKRFDMLAEEEARRLKSASAYGMQITHLFSNRLGERTIVGYIK